jgi:tRNA A-37 threonylcarbamoyl transferase component Bud32
VGKLIAKIHSLDIALGDCKPGNFIIHNNDKIYVIDLEQGERHGNKIWDVAEFCYFSGHYGNTLNEGLEQFISSFIKGYIQMGNKEILSKAAELGYERVFFTWTPIPIIHGISNLLKKGR